jgi:hypothetical protein
VGYVTIASGNNLTASLWNSEVRDQVVTPFVSTAARTSAIGSPVVGMASYLNTNNDTEGIETYNHAGQWRKPWNMPWGTVGYFWTSTPTGVSYNSPGPCGFNEAPMPSFTAVTNRYYRYDWHCSFAYSTVNCIVSVRIVDGTHQHVTWLTIDNFSNPTYKSLSGFGLDWNMGGCPGVVYRSVYAQADAQTPTFQYSNYPSFFHIQDVGPVAGLGPT